ncbi:DUF5131 family protein [Nannocystis pusilla]|uniref:DUF5131 family protein n=1 Tax=Nannocystis pusilla TaxID=889268 RepID=UPI003B7E2F20
MEDRSTECRASTHCGRCRRRSASSASSPSSRTSVISTFAEFIGLSSAASGSGARPMHPDWARSIRDQCEDENIPFFFKQWGGIRKKVAGRVLDGRTHDAYPHQATSNGGASCPA